VSTQYVVSPLLRIDRTQRKDAPWRLATGNGDKREFLDLNSGALFPWLCRASAGRWSYEDLCASAASALDVEETSAAELVSALIATGGLMPSDRAEALRREGERWEAWGWRDAFDFHFGTRAGQYVRLRRAEYEAMLRGLLADTAQSGPQPEPFKRLDYVECIDLNPLVEDLKASGRTTSLKSALLSSKPIRKFVGPPVSANQLAGLLRFAHGIQFTRPLILGQHAFRASPSGGARSPVEVYVAARTVDGIPPGIYHYDQLDNRLGLIANLSSDIVDATCFGKTGITTSSAVVYVTYRFTRHGWKYRYSRTYRAALLELGHNVQTTRLAASLVGLETYYSPAIDDEIITEMLRLPDDCIEGPMFAIGLGNEGTLDD